MAKEYVKTVFCYPAYLASLQSISYEMPGWMKHKLESRLLGEILITSYVDDTIMKAEKGITEPLDEGVRGE